MKLKNISNETASELLLYLVEHEDFPSLKGLKTFSKEEVIEILKEISLMLKEASVQEAGFQKADVSGFELSSQALSLISCLSPREETILFKSFRLL